MIKPWEKYPEIWPTESSFMSFVRGGIRKGLWERNPIKLNFLKNNRVKQPLGRKTQNNPKGQMIWSHQCVFCEEYFKPSEIQVDHKKGHHSLRVLGDLDNFISGMILVKEEDLQTTCKKCHYIKSYSEAHNITFEQAKLEKFIIQFKKLKAADAKRILSYYCPVDTYSKLNHDGRVNLFRHLIHKGEIDIGKELK